MSSVKTFFRHCPNCGRRFEIRLEGKKLIKEEQVKTVLTPSEQAARTEFMAGPASINSAAPLTVQTGTPIYVDVESFSYTYRCKHCGHEWSEVRQEEHAEKS